MMEAAGFLLVVPGFLLVAMGLAIGVARQESNETQIPVTYLESQLEFNAGGSVVAGYATAIAIGFLGVFLGAICLSLAHSAMNNES